MIDFGETEEQHNKRKNYKRHYRSVPVKCISPDGTYVIYSSIKEAHAKTGASLSGISHAASGINKSSGGYRWEYMDMGEEG